MAVLPGSRVTPAGAETASAARWPGATGSATGVRLRTLVLMRWIAVAGQTTTILVVYFVLHFQFPVVPALVAVGASAGLNVFLTLRHPPSRRLTDLEAGSYLVYDTLQLAFLLYLTGGLHNPYAFLMLTGVIVAAAVLSVRMTVFLVGLILVAASVLVFVHLPLPLADARHPIDEIPDLPLILGRPAAPDPALPFSALLVPEPGGQHPISHIYVFGLWTSLVVSMMFFAANVMRVAEEGRRMSNALTETQLALAREQRLSAVGGLAAAAAHELGTPLGTIALVAEELGQKLPADGPYAEDLQLLASQSKRCREILARLTLSPRGDAVPSFARLPLMALVELAARAAHRENVEIAIVHDPGLAAEPRRGAERPESGEPQPVVPHSLEIVHGLENLIQNALDFAATRAWVRVGWSERRVVVEIGDDGPGFTADTLGALGEPYVSTRRDAGGMGLGVFIAKTLLGRTGAELAFGNRPGGGARVVVTWPRARLAETLRPAGDPPDLG